MTSAQAVYEQSVKPLPPMERLRLAKIILEQLTGTEEAEVELSDAWSDQDMGDLTAFSLRRAARVVPAEDANV